MRFRSGGRASKAAVSLSATFALSDGKNKLIFKIEMLTHFRLHLIKNCSANQFSTHIHFVTKDKFSK